MIGSFLRSRLARLCWTLLQGVSVCLSIRALAVSALVSGTLQVFVFLAQDRHLVLEEQGVKAELGMNQRHVAEPAGEGVHTLLPLSKVLWV